MSQHAANLRAEALAALRVCMSLEELGAQPELCAKLRAAAQERIEASLRESGEAAASPADAAAPDAAPPNPEAHVAVACALQNYVRAGAPVLAADEAAAAPAASAAGQTMSWASRKERVAWHKANALAEMCADPRVPRPALPDSAPAPAPVKGQPVRPKRTKEERMAIHAAKMANRGVLAKQWGIQRQKDVDKEWQARRRERRAERARLQEVEHAERRAKSVAPKTAAAAAAAAQAPTREEELRTAWGNAVARARHLELDVEHLQAVVKRLREELADKEQTLQSYRVALQARYDAERADEEEEEGEEVVIRGRRRRINSDGVEEEEFEIPPGIVRPPPLSQESVTIDTPERPAARAAPPALRFHRLRPRQVVPASGSEEEQVGYDEPEGALDRLLEDLEATPDSPRPPSEWLSTRAAPPERGPAAEPGRVEMVLVVAPPGIGKIQID